MLSISDVNARHPVNLHSHTGGSRWIVWSSDANTCRPPQSHRRQLVKHCWQPLMTWDIISDALIRSAKRPYAQRWIHCQLWKNKVPNGCTLFLLKQLYCAICAVMKYIFVLLKIREICEPVPTLKTRYSMFRYPFYSLSGFLHCHTELKGIMSWRSVDEHLYIRSSQNTSGTNGRTYKHNFLQAYKILTNKVYVPIFSQIVNILSI